MKSCLFFFQKLGPRIQCSVYLTVQTKRPRKRFYLTNVQLPLALGVAGRLVGQAGVPTSHTPAKPQSRQRSGRHPGPRAQANSGWTSGLQNCKKTKSCCIKPPSPWSPEVARHLAEARGRPLESLMSRLNFFFLVPCSWFRGGHRMTVKNVLEWA